MARILLALLLLVSASAVRAEEISAADRAAITQVIEDQIAAFRVDDAVRAFSFASPGIQAKFGTPETFIDMVRTGYLPVYRARAASFRALTVENGVPVQAVEILGPDGVSVLALYFMEQQPDGTWKIKGCVLTKLPERVA
ncbi:MAG: DUF4864 domain-containing protein [Pseudomonadota bacterium]